MFQVFNVLISNFDRLKVQCVEVWSLLCTHTKTSISSLSVHEQNGQLDRNLSFYLERNCQRLYSPQGNWTRTNMLLIKGFKVSRSCQNFFKKNKYGPRNQTREGWLLRPTQSKPPMPLWLAVAAWPRPPRKSENSGSPNFCQHLPLGSCISCLLRESYNCVRAESFHAPTVKRVNVWYNSTSIQCVTGFRNHSK